MDRLLTPDDVARKLAKPRSYVMALARSGGLPYVAVGKRDRRFREEDVEAFIEVHRAYTPNDGPTTTPGQRRGNHVPGQAGQGRKAASQAVGRRHHGGLDAGGPADPKGALRIVRARGQGHAA